MVEELNDNGTTSPALLALLGDDIMTHTYVTLDQRALSRVVLAITSDEMANTMETPPLDLDVHELRKRGSTSDNVTNEDLHWPEDTYPNAARVAIIPSVCPIPPTSESHHRASLLYASSLDMKHLPHFHDRNLTV